MIKWVFVSNINNKQQGDIQIYMTCECVLFELCVCVCMYKLEYIGYTGIKRVINGWSKLKIDYIKEYNRIKESYC